MNSFNVVKALSSVDPGFVQLCETLFGDSVHPEAIWGQVYGVGKSMPDPADVSTFSSPAPRRRRGRLVERKAALEKSDAESVVWSGEFAKTDEKKRQVFGWASVVSVNGEPVADRQGDVMDPEDIEKAAYQYVMHSRTGGHQHRRTDDDRPFKASDMIESFVVTPEKIEKMGLPASTPCGWWVGFKVHDDEAWGKIEKGEVTGFSIHGRGKRRMLDGGM